MLLFSSKVSVFVYTEITKCFENEVRKLMSNECSWDILPFRHFTNDLLFWYLSTLFGWFWRIAVPPNQRQCSVPLIKVWMCLRYQATVVLKFCFYREPGKEGIASGVNWKFSVLILLKICWASSDAPQINPTVNDNSMLYETYNFCNSLLPAYEKSVKWHLLVHLVLPVLYSFTKFYNYP